MGQVLVGWLLGFAAIAGLGQWIRLIFGLRGGWLSGFWIGYAILIGGLQMWWLFAPVDALATVVFGGIGILGTIIGLIRQLRRVQFNPALILYAVGLILAGVWVTNRAIDSQLDFDSLFYHINAIRWRNEYPAIIGLGNLHYRLAFNQSFFLYCAWLNVYPYFYPANGMGYTFANSLLLMSLMATAWGAAFEKRGGVQQWVALAFLPLVLYRAEYQRYSANISSPSPDLGVYIFQIVITIETVRLLFDKTLTRREKRFKFILVIALAAVSITQKLSAIAFGGSLIVMLCVWWLWTHRADLRRELLRTIAIVGIVGGVIGSAWLAIGYITSGYPAFPNTFGALNVDFRIPESTTIEARDWIYSWARYPVSSSRAEDVLGNWNWLPTWIRLLNADALNIFLLVIPLYTFAGGVIVYLIRALLRRRFDLRYGILIIPAIIGGLFWWITAPDPRFSGAVFWILAVLIVVMIWEISSHSRWDWLIGLIAIGATGVVLASGYSNSFTNVEASLPIPYTRPTRSYKTESGFTYNIAREEDSNLQMGDPELPASPYLIPKLELRGKTLRDGLWTGK